MAQRHALIVVVSLVALIVVIAWALRPERECDLRTAGDLFQYSDLNKACMP